jgi:hypothetical protein
MTLLTGKPTFYCPNHVSLAMLLQPACGYARSPSLDCPRSSAKHISAYLCVHFNITNPPLCRFLLKHQEHLGPAAGQSLHQLGLLGPDKQGALVLLEPHTPTLLAYEKLAAAGVTGAPVLSSDGQIIANLSASDIRWVAG